MEVPLMKRIPLSRGLYALVDDSDYDQLRPFKWSVKPGASNSRYAVTNIRIEGTPKAGSHRRWKQVALHRMLLQPPADREVVFLNFDGLDCRRSILKVVSKSE